MGHFIELKPTVDWRLAIAMSHWLSRCITATFLTNAIHILVIYVVIHQAAIVPGFEK